MFKASFYLFFLFAVLQFSGCSSVQPTASGTSILTPTPTPEKSPKTYADENFEKEWKSLYEKTLTELERNRRLWSEQNIVNYEFRCEQFGDPMYAFVAVLIKVRDGKPFSLEIDGKNNELMRKDGYDKMTSFENMFDFIWQELENGRIIDVKYHETGRPTNFLIKYSYAIHGAKSVEITKFKAEQVN